MRSYNQCTIGDLLASAARDLPNSLALDYPRRQLSLTFSELDERVAALACGLVKIGVRPGQRVAVWGPGGPDWVASQFAIARAGAVMVALNPLLTEVELTELLSHSGAVALVTASAGPGFSALPVFQMDGTHGVGRPLEELVALGRSSEESLPAVELGDWALLQYTSGTTGQPKGVMLSHGSVVDNAHALMQGLGFTSQDRLCTQFPLFHCAGCVMSVIGAFSHGARLVPVEVFDAELTLELVQRCRCTALFGVPSMFMALFEVKNWRQYELSSLRTGTMGGSHCPGPLVSRIVAEMGIKEMTLSYGLTETSPILTLTPRLGGVERLLDNVGFPIPGTEVKIVEGEVVVRGPQLMMGYFCDSQATSEAIDGDGWFRTGDLGCIRKDGSLKLIGRSKELIIRGGENISPVEIEAVVREHPSVLDAAAFPVPHARLQETVGVAVRLQPDATLELEELRAFCARRLARFKLPERLRIVQTFPTTASGKIQRFRLAEGVHHVDDR